MPAPLVIAHRGACGYRPELTRSALELAIAQGAQAIEIDVVATSDGALILRHEPELSGTTDVAGRADLARHRTAREIDGRTFRGWFADDLTLAQVRSLTARERIGRLRPLSAQHDGREGVLTLQEAFALAAPAGVRLVVELKHPAYSASRGLPLEALLLDAVAGAPALPPLTIESFEHDALERLEAAGLRHPLVALLGNHPLRDLRTVKQPRAFVGFAGVSLRTGLATARTVGAFRDLGLDVWTWTLRPENHYLPPRYRLPAGRLGRYGAFWRRLVANGVTGVFADHPDLAHAVVGAPPAVGVPAYP
ncbi:glycerophosphodiester phosphodiesterase family protein [Amnibacterium sp.]|uniref:glycerophosphodiester phosphodiesterase family protein n=1 Tax=Amnibacterium sp. TaxID=1872496 RepID=UPI003F7CA1E1